MACMSDQSNLPVFQPALAYRVAVYLIALAATLMLLREARALVVPVLFALFLALLGTPAMSWLRSHRVPSGAAAMIVVLGMLGMLVGTVGIITSSVQALTSRVPAYQAALDRQINAVIGKADDPISLRTIVDTIDPGAGLSFLAGLLTELLGVLGNMFLILVIAAFMLVEGDAFPDRLRGAFGESAERDRQIRRFNTSLARYAGLKTIICLLTGLLAGLFCWLVGLDQALLLGFLAFVLNYIPNIGSWIAALPALLLAFIQFGPGGVLGVGIGYLAINVGVSNVIEPRLVGAGLGLSPLVVFLSVLGAGWALGPVGVILSIPLVMAVRLALEANPRTRDLALLLQTAGQVRAALEERADAANVTAGTATS